MVDETMRPVTRQWPKVRARLGMPVATPEEAATLDQREDHDYELGRELDRSAEPPQAVDLVHGLHALDVLPDLQDFIPDPRLAQRAHADLCRQVAAGLVRVYLRRNGQRYWSPKWLVVPVATAGGDPDALARQWRTLERYGPSISLETWCERWLAGERPEGLPPVRLDLGAQAHATLASLSHTTRQALAAMLMILANAELPEVDAPRGALADAEAAGLAHWFYDERRSGQPHDAYSMSWTMIAVLAALLVGEIEASDTPASTGGPRA